MNGFSKSTILRVVKKTDGKPDRKVPDIVEPVRQDNFDRGVVRRTIQTEYTHHNVIPTLQNINTALDETSKEMRSLGFTFT